jgi:hypothetical protein
MSVRLSVCLSASISAPLTGRIFLKFYIEDFNENMPRKLILGKIGQKYRALYVEA